MSCDTQLTRLHITWRSSQINMTPNYNQIIKRGDATMFHFYNFGLSFCYELEGCGHGMHRYMWSNLKDTRTTFFFFFFWKEQIQCSTLGIRWISKTFRIIQGHCKISPFMRFMISWCLESMNLSAIYFRVSFADLPILFHTYYLYVAFNNVSCAHFNLL